MTQLRTLATTNIMTQLHTLATTNIMTQLRTLATNKHYDTVTYTIASVRNCVIMFVVVLWNL